MIKIGFYFEISAAAGMAHNAVTGESTSCYAAVEIEATRYPEDYGQMAKDVRVAIAHQMGLPLDYLKPITKVEYDLNHDEGDTHNVQGRN